MNTSTDITVLNHLMAINLDVNIWSARKKLTPADFGGADLPPEELASLGSKKICNPEDLKIFGTLKSRAVNMLDQSGVRFLGGWGIPEDSSEEIVKNLIVIRDEFIDAKEQFLNRYNEAVLDWIGQHPGWEKLIGDSTVGEDYVRSRIGFKWQMFKLLPSTNNDVVDMGLQDEIYGLGKTLYEEVAKAATDTWHRCYAGKNKVTHKALSPLRTIHQKLTGLSFVEPRVVPILDLLTTAFNKIPAKGYIQGSDLLLLQGVVTLLRDPEALVEHAQKILEGGDASDILNGLLADDMSMDFEIQTEPVPPLLHQSHVPINQQHIDSHGLW
ncbi:MAG: DUF3150 domain-containing protein [Desulfobacterium sp.]|nr:DUF3150 domain-containing protein [Desulfobacterium sp.]